MHAARGRMDVAARRFYRRHSFRGSTPRCSAGCRSDAGASRWQLAFLKACEVRMAHTLRFGVAYDFRNPPDSGIPNPKLYAQVLEQVAFADRLGFDLVWLTEHHFVDDAYLPSFAVVAGAIAARTSRIRISTDIALAPFHHPLRLAEDLAVLDNLSGGRMELGLGLAYAPHEFRAFGIPRAQRVSRSEEAIQILRQAWSGEPVRFS